MAKCLSLPLPAMRPRSPRFASDTLDAPIAQFAPLPGGPALNSFRHPLGSLDCGVSTVVYVVMFLQYYHHLYLHSMVMYNVYILSEMRHFDNTFI